MVFGYGMRYIWISVQSYTYNEPVWDVIAARIPVTLYLAILALLLSMPVGMLFGVITAVKRGTKTDTAITLIANITSCLPPILDRDLSNVYLWAQAGLAAVIRS